MTNSFSDDKWSTILDKLYKKEILKIIETVEKKKEWNLTHLKTNYSKKTKQMTSNKENIIRCFKLLINKINAYDEKGGSFKIRELTDTIKALSDDYNEIDSIYDAEKILLDYGKKKPEKTLLKIKEILETGTLKVVEEAKNDPRVIAVNNLTKIYSIGIKKAIELYEKYNIVTIDDLKTQFKARSNILHDKQIIGLKYYDDLCERIPKNEMDEYNRILSDIVRLIDPDINFSINGSYRRKMSTSGDIDVLISSYNGNARKNFILELKKTGIIKDTLADGSKKFMGISKLENIEKFRHIDIIECKKNEYPFAQLYFTGSGGFNAKMRGMALEKGYSMNEYCLSHKSTKKQLSTEEIFSKIGKENFENEKDIFDFLDIEYVLPENRVNLTPSKIK
tara:strand:+ start:645 stop:1823 length:1179 start_codon:yes stop_codon:yes gene_type:complete